MSRKGKKAGSFGYILLLCILVTTVLAVVGVCIAWVNYSSENALEILESSNDFKLGDLFETYKDSEAEIAGSFRVVAAFGILTVILSGATLVLAGISKVLGWKLFRFLLIVAAVVCVVCAVVSIVTTYTYCDKAFGFEIGDIAKGSWSPAAGAWLTAVGGALSGLLGIGAAAKG